MTATVPAPPDSHAGLVDHLLGSGALDAAWKDAFLAVPRHAFLPPVFWIPDGDGHRRVDRSADEAGWMAAACADTAAVTQWDDGDTGAGQAVPTSSASMPTMVATMLGDLGVHDGDRVLEVGTGTGWNAALLAHRLGAARVVTVELDEAVAARAAANLAAAGPAPLAVVGDGAQGWPAAAPYDAVLSTCSVARVPRGWIEQTRPGATIVTPFSPLFGGGAVVRLTRAGDGTGRGRFTRSSAFMMLRQHRYQAPPVDAYLPGEWPGDADRSATGLDPEALGGNWPACFVVGLSLPDVYYRRTPYGDGWTWWLFDTAVTSWATVDSLPGAGSFDVRQSGPRRLWDEVEAAWDRWRRDGEPDVDHYGLTVGPDGHQAWLEDPGNPLR